MGGVCVGEERLAEGMGWMKAKGEVWWRCAIKVWRVGGVEGWHGVCGGVRGSWEGVETAADGTMWMWWGVMIVREGNSGGGGWIWLLKGSSGQR